MAVGTGVKIGRGSGVNTASGSGVRAGVGRGVGRTTTGTSDGVTTTIRRTASFVTVTRPA
jgi:hypothetical protein